MIHTKAHKRFTHLFPSPAFLTMPSVGLDISDRRVRFLEFAEGKNGLTIKRFGEMKIPPGVIISGSIQKLDELRKVLSDLRKKYNLEFVKVSLPEERAYLVKMEVPNVSESELRDGIAFQLEEHVPIRADEAIFDYQIIRKDKKNTEVLVSVFAEKEVRGYVDMFDGTGMTPVSFEIEAQAITRAVVPFDNKDACMIVDIGRTRTGVSILNDGVVRFTSTIDVGSETITNAIEKNFSVTPEEAEKIKNERKISKSAADKEFFLAVISTLSILQDEINKLYIYWHTYRQEGKNKKRIKKLILCGGGANLKGLEDYLSASLRMPVDVANPWINVNSFDNYIPQIPSNEALGYAAVIGLALHSKF